MTVLETIRGVGASRINEFVHTGSLFVKTKQHYGQSPFRILGEGFPFAHLSNL